MRPRREPPTDSRDGQDLTVLDRAGVLLVMDGNCALCSATARLVARLDRRDEVRICTAQSPLGRALLLRYGLEPDDPESWLMLRDGAAHEALDAILRLFPALHPLFWPLRILWLLPPGGRDWLYRRIARNRYRFGRSDLCALPDPELQRRLIR